MEKPRDFYFSASKSGDQRRDLGDHSQSVPSIVTVTRLSIEDGGTFHCWGQMSADGGRWGQMEADGVG